MPQQPVRHVLPLAGYPVLSTSSVALSRLVKGRMDAARQTVLLFANTNFVMQCQSLRSWLCGEDVVIVNDGVGMDIAALLQHGRRFQENLNGTDFVPFLFRHLAPGHRVFLLGGKPGVAAQAALAFGRMPGPKVVGWANGYEQLHDTNLCQRINASGADIVLVALGNPAQEQWIRAHLPALKATLFVGVGALFDFLTGGAKRAPRWVQSLRLEWLYRMAREPRRLGRRYTVDVVRFLVLCLQPSHRILDKPNTLDTH